MTRLAIDAPTPLRLMTDGAGQVGKARARGAGGTAQQ